MKLPIIALFWNVRSLHHSAFPWNFYKLYTYLFSNVAFWVKLLLLVTQLLPYRYTDLTWIKDVQCTHTHLKCSNLVNFEIPNGFLYYGNDFGISKLTRLYYFKCVTLHPLFKWNLCIHGVKIEWQLSAHYFEVSLKQQLMNFSIILQVWALKNAISSVTLNAMQLFKPCTKSRECLTLKESWILTKCCQIRKFQEHFQRTVNLNCIAHCEHFWFQKRPFFIFFQNYLNYLMIFQSGDCQICSRTRKNHQI